MRIYVSSTSEDLRDFRAAVVEQLMRLGHQVVSMEGYTADARGPVEKCLADVASAEAYVGLFAFYYGSVPDGYEHSVTEMEFHKACELALPRLVFLVPDDASSWPPRFFDRGEKGEPMERLRRKLLAQKGFTVAFFKDLTELLMVLPQAIRDIEAPPFPVDGFSPIQKESFRDLAKPLSFEAESSKHLPQFTGREWVEAKLDDWITNKRSSIVFCLVGGPGIGKSAIACHWCHTRTDIIAFHHCVYGHKEKTDPKRILLSLVAKMAKQLPEYEKRLSVIGLNELKEATNADARAVFDNFLLRPLSGDIPDPDRDWLVVIDGLDEASRDQDNELASFIGEMWGGLPQWLRLVVTTRPELDVSGYLEHLHPFILNAGSPENLQDIRTFLRRGLGAMKIHASDEVVNEIVDKSEGLFLYAKVVLDEVREGRLSLDQMAEFPEGLTGYYKRWFDRKLSNRELYQNKFHKLVSAIIAQRAPLPFSTLCSVLELSSHELHQRLMILGVLFPLREECQGNQKVTFVTLMHKSLHDWLTEVNPATLRPRAGSFAADLELGNRLLAEEGWKVYSAGKLSEHPYFNQTLLSHLSETQQTKKLASVLLEPALIDTLWSNEFRYEWQRHISSLRHTLSLTDLVQNWLDLHGSTDIVTAHDAVVVGKLGRLFQEMGAFDEAILLAEAALRIWQANNVADAPDMVGSLLVLGKIQSVREELDQATGSYEKALTIAQRAYAQDSLQMADVFYELCVFYNTGKRDYKKAWDCLEKCLAICSRCNPPDFARMANCINDKAVILEAEGKAADYMGFYQEALSLFEKARPDGHPEMVATLGNIGYELRKQGKVDDAVKVFRRAVKIADDILLPQHEYSNGVRIRLTSALLALGKYDEALEVMRTHVAELERFPGPDHDDTAEARLQLCNALLHVVHLSDTAKRDSYREEVRIQSQRIRQAEPATILGLLELAEDSRRAAELSLSDCLLDTVRRTCRGNAERPHSNPVDSVSAKCFAGVLEALMSSKPLSELASQIRTLWEGAEPQMKHQADCLPKTRKVIVCMISWFARTRLVRDSDAEGIHQAFDLITQIGVESPETLDQLASLTVSLHHRHHEEISELLCQRLMEKSERILGPEHIQTQNYLENLAHLKAHRGKFEEAEHLYRRAFQSRLNTGGSEQSNTLSTITSLAECLLLQGSTEAAQTLIREFVSKLPPGNAFSSARKMLARCLSSSGMELKNEFSAFEESKVCYELSLEIDVDNATTHNNMALLLWVCLHDAGTAADHFNKSLALNPTDGNAHSNYAHLFAQTMNNPKQAHVHFKKAMSLDPNGNGIPANYAAMLLQQGDVDKAWSLSKRSMRLCLPYPDRIMARPLFCATAILLLREQDAYIPLGQMKGLFAHGIDHVTWIITALLKLLDHQLPADSSQLMRAISDAISDKKHVETLEAYPKWQSVKLGSFDTPWPEL